MSDREVGGAEYADSRPSAPVLRTYQLIECVTISNSASVLVHLSCAFRHGRVAHPPAPESDIKVVRTDNKD
ncbi:hypothetical protein J6590_044912 [Homalodisca vitripennis]|nr:hypothetical protein J6590_044912 [Homalodisca vitripennis]